MLIYGYQKEEGLPMTKFQKAIKWLSLAGFILLAGVLIFESCMPGKVSSSHSGAVSNVVVDTTERIEEAVGGSGSSTEPNQPTLSALIRENWGKFNHYIRKGLGHFGAFLVLAIFGTVAFELIINKKWLLGALVSVALGVMIAMLTELIQLYIPGRAGSWSDVGLDSFGYFVGALLTFIVMLIVKAVRRKRERN